MPNRKTKGRATMPGGRATRRDFLERAALLACAPLMFRSALAQGSAGRVVVIGGGFAGATCARALKRLDPRLAVTLVEANASFTACPFSNEVITGLRDLRDQVFTYDEVAADGVALVLIAATGVDPQ